jgi:two-component system response regulator ResD
MKILIADDDAVMRAFVQRVVEHSSHDAVVAENGRDALDLVQREDPDLLITDLCMPEMDGFALVEELQKLPRHSLLPVICLSSLNSREDIARLIALGISDYVLKPVKPFDLAERIRTVSLRTAGWKRGRRNTPFRAGKAIR